LYPSSVAMPEALSTPRVSRMQQGSQANAWFETGAVFHNICG
jgi:hypothetical protein